MPLNDAARLVLIAGLALVPMLGLRWRAQAIFRLLAADLRPERILHYVAMVLLGAAVLVSDGGALPSFGQSVAMVGLLVALPYAAVFAIVSNNIEDLAIDRISNAGRPLARGAIAIDPYRRLGRAALGIALVLAALAGPVALLGVATVSAIYHAYSCPPLRLKRVPVFAKLMIGANSAILAVGGFVLAGGRWDAFPLPWLTYLLLGVGLAANFVDLKDTAGDAADGVHTLPVLLGQRRAQWLILLATVAAYAGAALLLGAWSLLPLNLALLAWHLRELRRVPYLEARVFRVYLLGQAALVGALCLLSRFDLP